MEPKTLILILTSILFGVFGQISLKHGMNNLGPLEIKDIFSRKLFSIIFEKFVFIGIVFYLIATLIWLVILSKIELSTAYPMLAIGYVIIALLSKFLLNENLTLLKFVGIVLISVGVFLVLKS
ncbi:MAG: EamA family transporter [Candidatus Aenigmatarchaeota archaeon]